MEYPNVLNLMTLIGKRVYVRDNRLSTKDKEDVVWNLIRECVLPKISLIRFENDECSNQVSIYPVLRDENQLNKSLLDEIHYVSDIQEDILQSLESKQLLCILLRLLNKFNATDDIERLEDSQYCKNEFDLDGNKVVLEKDNAGKLKVSSQIRDLSNTTRNKIISWTLKKLRMVKFVDPSFINDDIPRNLIFFGAPGTGKSYQLNESVKKMSDVEYTRVTFYSDYSYNDFVGTYKPVSEEDSIGNNVIKYKFVPGPFLTTLVSALKSIRSSKKTKPYVLIVEEINRANMSAVFGNVFQLLDRGDQQCSEYKIETTQDVRKYIAGELGLRPEDCKYLKIPNNMYIYATMNSADQGVYFMDTAFKRRWSFKHIDIDDSENEISNYYIQYSSQVVNWNALRKSINDFLMSHNVNEDKLIGPFYIPLKTLKHKRTLKNTNEYFVDKATFDDVFKNKIISYLFEDVAKFMTDTIFAGCIEKSGRRYSRICKEYDLEGINIFNDSIVDKV